MFGHSFTNNMDEFNVLGVFDNSGTKPDLNLMIRFQVRPVIRLLRTDPMISGSNPPSAKLSLRVRKVAPGSGQL